MYNSSNFITYDDALYVILLKKIGTYKQTRDLNERVVLT